MSTYAKRAHRPANPARPARRHDRGEVVFRVSVPLPACLPCQRITSAG